MSKKTKIILCISIVLLYIRFLLSSQDQDMFFTISSGRDLLNGNFHTNSHTGLPIIIQQWLYAIILTKFDSFGYIGDILFVLIQNIILWYVSYIFLFRKTNNRFKSIIGPILLTVISHNYLINIRPQIITMILLVIELLVLDIYKEHKNFKILLLLIPIGMLSANMHQAIFLYHIFIMIPYMYDNKKLDIKIIISAPIMFLTSLFTPYGIDGSLFIFKALNTKVFDKITIKEINPINIKTYLGTLMILIVFYVIIANYKHTSNKYINFYSLSIFILTMLSIRHISILYIALLFIWINLDVDIDIPPLYASSTIILSTLLLLILFENPIDLKITTSNKIDKLDEIPKNAKIYNTLNIGSYLEYKGYNVSIDARPELYTKELCGEDRINDYRIVEYGLNEDNFYVSNDTILNILQDYEYVILRHSSYSTKIIQYKYKQVSKTDDYIIFAK